MAKKKDKQLLKEKEMQTSPKETGTESKPKNMNPDAPGEEPEKVDTLKGTTIHAKHNKVMPELTNDLAYFLHHPQLAPEHKQFPTKDPKC